MADKYKLVTVQSSRRVKRVKMGKVAAKSLTTEKSRQHVWPTRVRLFPLAACLLILGSAGCQGIGQNQAATRDSDPILGVGGLRPPGTPSPAASAGGTKPSGPVSVLPPAQPNSSTMSPAALAATTPRTLDKDRDLRIGNPQPIASNDGWGRQGIIPASEGTGAVLRRPEVIAEPVARTNPPTSETPAANGDNRLASDEQALKLLEARGVLWKNFDTVPETGEWRFVCIVPSQRDPHLRRTYEARSRDKLEAMQAVIDKIDSDRQ